MVQVVEETPLFDITVPKDVHLSPSRRTLDQVSAMEMPVLRFLSERQAAPATPEYKDESYAGNLLAIHGTFCGVALLSVLLRLYVRIFMLKSLGTDDYLIVAASVSSIVIFRPWDDS